MILFLDSLPRKPGLSECCPNDVCRFLVWKDKAGKNKVHGVQCKFLGTKGKPSCNCPVRLASGSVSVMVQHLVDIFCDIGAGRVWDELLVEIQQLPLWSEII